MGTRDEQRFRGATRHLDSVMARNGDRGDDFNNDVAAISIISRRSVVLRLLRPNVRPAGSIGSKAATDANGTNSALVRLVHNLKW